MTTQIAHNIIALKQQLLDLSHKYRRENNSVHLLAVSKTKPIDDIKEAYQAGQKHFGENYIQEAVEKIQTLADLDITWHLLGPIQSNKTKLVAENFDWVESLERLKIAERLHQQRPGHLPPLNVLVQVNITDESQKSGVQITEVPSLCAAIVKLPNLKLRGLMAIGHANSIELTTQAFERLQTLYQQLEIQFDLDTLSLGMSDDLELAIAHGSTQVRLGTAIFGARR